MQIVTPAMVKTIDELDTMIDMLDDGMTAAAPIMGVFAPPILVISSAVKGVRKLFDTFTSIFNSFAPAPVAPVAPPAAPAAPMEGPTPAEAKPELTTIPG